MVAWPPQTVPNLHPSPPSDCPANYSARRRRVDLLRLMVALRAPVGALERPAQEPQSGALVHVQIVSSIAVEHFPIANTSLEMPSASLVSRRREGAGSLVERGGRILTRRAPHAAGKLDRRSNCHKSGRLCHNTRAASLQS